MSNRKSKETIFFLAPYPLGQAPSQRFRFEQYISILEKEGFECEFHPFYNEKAWKIIYAKGKVISKAYHVLLSFLRRKLLLLKLVNADHIFIHREMSHIGPPIFEWFLAKILKKKFTYDFDDAIWLPNYSDQNASFQRLKMYKKVNYLMKIAHQITAGNEYLKNYAEQYNTNVIYLPTTIDLNYHNYQSKTSNKLVVGWTGSHTTAKYLEVLLEPVKRLSEKYDFDFLVISNEDPDFNLKNFRFVKWKKSSEIEDLNKIDIGLMPLEDNVWTQGKCAFKILQYMALGKACVASSVGANNDVIRDGENGLFSHSNADWFEKIESLILNKDQRQKLGSEAAKTVREKYSVEANKEKYLGLFKK